MVFHHSCCNNDFVVKTPSRIEVNEILNNKFKKEFFEDSFVINTVAIVGKENSNSCLIDDYFLSLLYYYLQLNDYYCYYHY